MTLSIVYFNGFESGKADGADLGTLSAGGNGITTAAKRSGTYGLDIDAADSFTPTIAGLHDLTKVVNVAAAYRNTSYDNDNDILSWGGSTESSCLKLVFESSGSLLQLWRTAVLSGSGTQLASVASPMLANTYQHIEVSSLIKSTGGFCTVWVDGVAVIEFTGDTAQGSDPPASDSIIAQFETHAFADADLDDVVIAISDQAAVVEQIGDAKIVPMLLNANGAQSDFVGSDADSVDNYLLVDERPGSMTDYVESSTVGHQDFYGTDAAIDSGDTVLAVGVKALALKDDAGTRTMAMAIRQGATEASSAGRGLATSSTMIGALFTVDPVSGIAFTPSDVNSLEVGVEIAS